MAAIFCAAALAFGPPTAAPVARRVASSQVQKSKMVDQSVLIGGAVGLLGSLGGVALVMFTEQAGERTVERGSLTGAQAAKFAGKFMEDEEMDQSGTISDVVARMEAALAEKGDKPAEPEPEPETPSKKTNSDGW